MSQPWRPFYTAPQNRPIEVWHVLWKCVLTIEHKELPDTPYPWVSATRDNSWPTEAFTHWRELSSPPEE